jgi:hypothetical protein
MIFQPGPAEVWRWKAIPGSTGSLLLGAISSMRALSVTLVRAANGEPNIAGYRVPYGTATGSYPKDVGNNTAGEVALWTITPPSRAQPGRPYGFRSSWSIQPL